MLISTSFKWRHFQSEIILLCVRWYLSRAVDSQGNTLEFLLSATRNVLVTKRFFSKALAVPHISTPRVITVVKMQPIQRLS